MHDQAAVALVVVVLRPQATRAKAQTFYEGA
jgi:hypothetical protein